MTYIRQKDIFIYLLNSNIGLSGKDLAERFNVSSRTIRSDIKSLNDITNEYGVSISSSKQKGYFIPRKQKNMGISIVKKVFNKEEMSTKIPNTPSERTNFIIYKLAFTNSYITMEELSDMLFVSKTTVYLDVRNIIKFLDRFSNLELEISPIKGLRLKGNERAKRSLISNILKREKRNDELMLSRSFYYALNNGNLNFDKEILFLYEIIINVLNKHGYILTDADVSLLVKDILVSIKRVQMGFNIEEKIEGELDLTMAEAIKEDVEEYFNILIDSKELEYFQQSFNTKRLLNITSKNYVLKEEGEKIVDEFLKEIKSIFNIDLTESTSFRRNLILHLNPMIERIKANHFEDNPLKNQIKVNYPLAFEISMLIVPIISKRLDVVISETEVSYIALHVAVALDKIHKRTNIAIVCGSGLGTAQLVKSKILSYYNTQVNIVGYFPVYKLENILKGEYGKVDLIISTIPLKEKAHIPIVQVNPLINDNDLIRIKKHMDNPLVGVKETDIDKVRSIFFKIELFKYFVKETDYFRAIFELTRMLKEQNFIDDVETFYSSVVEREELYSTILDGMIAIPHPMESMSRTTVVSVGIFNNPIIHNDKKVKAILLFAINAKEDDKLKVLYKLLQEMMESETIIQGILHSTNFDTFIENI